MRLRFHYRRNTGSDSRRRGRRELASVPGRGGTHAAASGVPVVGSPGVGSIAGPLPDAIRRNCRGTQLRNPGLHRSSRCRVLRKWPLLFLGISFSPETGAISMAQRVHVVLVDDIDGSDAGETVTFGL